MFEDDVAEGVREIFTEAAERSHTSNPLAALKDGPMRGFGIVALRTGNPPGRPVTVTPSERTARKTAWARAQRMMQWTPTKGGVS